jgi:hypothetical protein
MIEIDPMSNLKKIGMEAVSLLQELQLSNLPSRPFDNSFELFDSINQTQSSLVVMGLNGSMDDNDWTNQTAIEDGIQRPEYSNLESGMKNGWGTKKSKILPERLHQVANTLGFSLRNTIFTNAILICSENSDAIRTRAELLGRFELKEIIEFSMQFHKHFTFKKSKPKAIVIHGNSLYSFSAMNTLRQTHKTSELRHLYHSRNLSSYCFETFIDGRPVPTLALPHMSRVAPDRDSLPRFRDILEHAT